MSGEKHKELLRREHQVAELIAWEAAKKEIPEMLQKLYGGVQISVRTVENICRNIYEKLHINKANELSALWFCRYYGVDEDLSPIKQLRNTAYSILFLIIMIPQTCNLDQALPIKHLDMIRFAIGRWIDHLEEIIEDLKSEEMLAIHHAELAEFESLHCMIDQLLLKQ